jgi:serine/threonine protein kinase/tetratricopeptide (TPR) repeat protein
MGPLNPELWQEIKAIAADALEQPDSEREDWVRDACKDDPIQLSAVLQLLGFVEAADETLVLERTPSLGRFHGKKIGPYQVHWLLGAGGLGEVYLATRVEKVRMRVALKFLRPDCTHPGLVRRFHNEMQFLAGLGHPNIVRLLDAGETAEAQPYFVMEFVDGKPIDKWCFDHQASLEQRLTLFRTVCEAADHAHRRLLVHRDLKPNNILVTHDGTVKLLDFGIARLLRPELLSGMSDDAPTAIWERPLTPAYASPEQLQGGTITAASDIYALGVILFELLTGRVPFPLRRGSTWREFVHLVGEEKAPRPSMAAALPGEKTPDQLSVSFRHQLKGELDDIALKALDKLPERRYVSAQEMADDISRYQHGLPVRAHSEASLYRVVKLVKRHLVAGGWKRLATGVAVAVGAVVIILQLKSPPSPNPHFVVKVLLADLENKTGDPGFTGALEPPVSLAMEDTAFITSYDRGKAHEAAAELQPGATRLDANLARLVALREGVNVVISGAVSIRSGKYRISLEAQDSAKGTVIKSTDATANSREEVLELIGKLTAPIRKALGDATLDSETAPQSSTWSVVRRVVADWLHLQGPQVTIDVKQPDRETYSAGSLEAAQKYAQAQQAQQKGDWDDAVRLYEETLRLDPNSGRAFAGIASTLANQGRRQEAQKNYELALTKLGRMTDREKYRTRAGYFIFMGDYPQALEQSQKLVAAFPADTAGLGLESFAYFLQRDMDRAKQISLQAVGIDPGNVLLRNNAGLFAMYAGDFDEAIRESQEILKTKPKFNKALLCIALAEAGLEHLERAGSSWQQLGAIDKDGASSAALGIADLALYEGRFTEIIKALPPAIATDLNDHNESAAALKRMVLAQAHLGNGEQTSAIAAVERALKERMDEPIAFPAAEIFLSSGEDQRAASVASMLKSRIDPQARAYAGVIEGLIHLKRKDYSEAVTTLLAAQKLSDTWLGRLATGRAYLEMGAFPQAETELDNCIHRRGEVTAVFFDDEPTMRYLPAAYYFRGRAREALQNPGGAAEDYRSFLRMKEHSQRDPLVNDAMRRLSRL